jgi:hypothetical protein
MPLASVRPALLLRSRFVPQEGLRIPTRLSLFSDRIEVHRMGLRHRVIRIADIEDVTVSTWGEETPNLHVVVRGEAPLVGRVEAVLAWKYSLMELLGRKALPQMRAEEPAVFAEAA